MKGKLPPILSLWLLLTVSLVIFIGLSFSRDISIGDYTLAKPRFSKTLLASHNEENNLSEELADTIRLYAPEEILAPDTTVHNVLVFGDSMTHHLAMSISKYGTKNKYKVTGVTWESSSIPGWANSGKIDEYLKMSKPQFVVVSLGSNEMELKHFERRIPDVKKIVEKLDTIPFVWIGPPLWKEDKGVYSMLEKALPPGVLFRTEGVEIPRGPDHIHPTRKGADVWADTIMRWIRKSPHPILTEVPDSGTTIKGHKFIYLHPND